MTVVNVNPLYTARELEHQLNDSGATAIVVLENFAHTLQQVLRRRRRSRPSSPRRSATCFPRPKALLTNLVVKHVKKMVPRVAHPDAIDVQGRAAARARADAGRRAARPRRHRVPAVHRRHDRRGEGRDPDPRQHGGQPAAGARRGSRAICRTARRRPSCRCRCTTSTR